MTDLALSCNCGKFKARAKDVSKRCSTRMVCYCKDCRAYGEQFKDTSATLDAYGGTEVYQVTQDKFEIEEGGEFLRCFRLTDKGLNRFYASCCGTPVGNLKSTSIPLLSLIHDIIDKSIDRDQVLGPILYRIHGSYVKVQPTEFTISPRIPLMLKLRIFPRLALAYISGKGQPSVFLKADNEPTVEVIVGTIP